MKWRVIVRMSFMQSKGLAIRRFAMLEEVWDSKHQLGYLGRQSSKRRKSSSAISGNI